jgi:hypothetical protein
MYCQTSTVGRIVEEAGNFNVYDIRLPCDFPLCYDFSRLDDYLAQDSVRAALGVGDRKYALIARVRFLNLRFLPSDSKFFTIVGACLLIRNGIARQRLVFSASTKMCWEHHKYRCSRLRLAMARV